MDRDRERIGTWTRIGKEMGTWTRTGTGMGKGKAALHRAPPELWPWLEGEEVRGLTSVAVLIDRTGTVPVEAVKAPPVPGVQNLFAG
jgi:hypothetical protein